MRLFSEIVRHVWAQRQESSQGIMKAARGNLDQLRHRKGTLVDFYLDGKLDQKTYDERVAGLKDEIDVAELELRTATLEQMDIEAVLEFAEKLVERPRGLWTEATSEQRPAIAKRILPRCTNLHPW
jgi:hypothetical protein